jgi:NADH-quinone oxidoreductase subunit M
MLKSYQKISLGEKNNLTAGFIDLNRNEKLVLIPLVIMIFLIGIYPKPFLDIAEPSVKTLQAIMHVSGGMAIK